MALRSPHTHTSLVFVWGFMFSTLTPHNSTSASARYLGPGHTMGLEYRTFALLADGDELKAREVALNDLPRTKDGEYLPHEALLGKDETVKISKEVLLFYPHDNVTEVRFVNPGKKLGPLVVRMVLEKTESMCERYGDEVTSESARDMIEFLRACGTAVPSTLTTIQVSPCCFQTA